MDVVTCRCGFMDQIRVARLKPRLSRQRLITEGAGIRRPVDERFDKFLHQE